MKNITTGFVLQIIIFFVNAFLFMIIWNYLIAFEIGLNKVSFGCAIGVSLVPILFSGYSYSDVKAVAADKTFALYYRAYLSAIFGRILFTLAIGAIAYFYLT